VSAVRWIRRDLDSSETLTLVRRDSGKLAIQITSGPDVGDDFVGLYDLDGDQIQTGSTEWTVVGDSDVSAEQIESITEDWESGTCTIERLAEVQS
jgi:hypothetical protein